MRVLTASPDDLRALAGRWSATDPVVVIALCAAWCNTCEEFRATFERVANVHPDKQFVWLDIEDDHALCGDIDVENFPTIAVFRGDAPLHFGVSLPHEAMVERLVRELGTSGERDDDVPDEVVALPAVLRASR